jgi:RNA polymerase sigma-70 factor (ECF subfamily)
MLIDGVPGIVLAPRGRAAVLLLIGLGADNRIHTIDITGDADRIRRATLTLPRWPIQQPHRLAGYQRHLAQLAGRSAISQGREHHGR